MYLIMLWHLAEELMSTYGKWDPPGRAGCVREQWFTVLPCASLTFLRTSMVGEVEINWRWTGVSEIYLGIRNLKYIHFSDVFFVFIAKPLPVINQGKSWVLNSLWRCLNCPVWLYEEWSALCHSMSRNTPRKKGAQVTWVTLVTKDI